jgi:alkaline phosphatase
MATGVKVNNGAVSFDGTDIETVLEQYAQAGKSSGLVTVFDSVIAATPAAFASHTSSRTDSFGIADDFCRGVSPNVLFGGNLTDLYLNALLGVNTSCVSPYSQVVSDLTGLMELAPVLDGHYVGEFSDVLSTGSEHAVSLDARTQKALELLEINPEGFFLLVEHAETDKYGHMNNLLGVIQAVIEFDQTVQGVMAWRAGRETLTVIVAPAHEPGGLVVTDEQPVAGQVPAHTYSPRAHTAADLPIFVEGPGAEYTSGVLPNTEVYWILRQGRLSP